MITLLFGSWSNSAHRKPKNAFHLSHTVTCHVLDELPTQHPCARALPPWLTCAPSRLKWTASHARRSSHTSTLCITLPSSTRLLPSLALSHLSSSPVLLLCCELLLPQPDRRLVWPWLAAARSGQASHDRSW